MTYQVLAILLLVFIGIAFISGLVFAIFYIGRKSVQDNPDKAIVLKKTGQHITPYKGVKTAKSRSGISFKYDKKIVLIPNAYHETYILNKRIIFVNKDNQIIASPFDDDVSISSSEKNDLIYELIESHIGADGMRALRGNNMPSVILVGVLAFAIGVVVCFGFLNFQDSMKDKQTGTQQTQEQPAIKPAIPDNASQEIK